MQTKIYALKTILDTITKYKKPDVKKRLIFNQSPVGGLGSKWIIASFLFLPFVEYALIFNPYIFNMLGIAQAIIFFVVLNFLHIIIVLVILQLLLKNKVY